MTHKYKIGDRVKFVSIIDNRILNYYTETNGIPKELIIHGRLPFKINVGEIVNIYNEYYIVTYIGDNNDIVQLGFKEKDIELLNNNINKELTSLPEKWSLIIDNIEDIKPYLLKKYGKIDSWFNDISRKFRLFSNETGYIPPSYVSTNLNLLDGYTEITLEQFKKWVIIKEEVSLVGRYIKALVDNAQNSKIIKDKYYLIKKHIDTAITIDNGYQLDTQYQNKYYELMPIGFNIPDEQEVTNKFEVGKWYKGKISSNTDNIYIKFKKIKEGDGYNYIYYSEKIKDGIYSIREDYWASNELEKYALNNPVDLSEIQAFLPDGHVDKINTKKHTFTNVRDFTFEEDKIYFYIGYLVKFKKENEKVNNYINLAVKSYKINEQFNFNDNDTNIRLATPDEIEWFEICEKAGKYVDKPIKKSNQKHVKDLKYPDVVEINSQEEYNAIGNINGYDMPYNKSDKAYLIDKDGKIGCGKASNMKCYSSKEFDYNHYKFSDLIFPEVSAKHCEVTGNSTTVDIPEYVECIKVPKGWEDFTKLRGIYKTCNKSYPIGKYRILCPSGGGQSTIGFEDHFTPSTKEAYDKQQALLNGGIFAVEYEKAPIDLSNTKIWIGDNPELSKLVQEKAFELGFSWLSGINEINNTDKEALYFYDDRDITHSSSGKAYFKDKKHKEIYPSDLGIRITQVNILGIERKAFYKELPNNNNNQINKLQRVKPKLIEIKKLN